MKVAKPVKVPILTRVVELGRRPHFNVTAMLGFRLSSPRALVDEMTFWATTGAQLGELAILDESVVKPRGELLVCGTFHAPRGEPVAASFVAVGLGPLEKRLAVIGDRFWHDGTPTAPLPMTTMPIDWAHAFGGPSHAANLYGKGADLVEHQGKRVQPLPNVEPFDRLLRTPSERPLPAGLLAMDVTFAQRRKRAGTYDRRWFEEHFPGLPPDMDPTFFNLAPEDQWIDGFWRGDEELWVENMHPDRPRIEGRLPGLVTRALVTQRGPDGERFVDVPMRCDTVWLFPAADLGVVAFHGTLPVSEDDAMDVLHLVVACEQPGHPRSQDHYQQALHRRLDKDTSGLAGLSDADLMPERDSGVTPNAGGFDVGRWIKSERLAEANARRGEERQFARARARCEAEGLDPREYGLAELPPEPEALPEDDLDALAAFAEAQAQRADAAVATLDEEEARAKERSRRLFADMGLDYDVEQDKALRDHAGPPKFSAIAHLEHLREEAQNARAGGAPIPQLEQQLADPNYQAQLLEQEKGLREMYRSGAHLRPSPNPTSPEGSHHARIVLQAALDSGESLAERDFTGVAVGGMSLRGIDLAGAFLESSDLSGCDLSGANLENAVLAKANLTDANLTGARLRGANLGAAKLHRAVLDDAELGDAILSRAELDGASFARARLAGTDLLFTKFNRANLSTACLPGVTVLKADLGGVSLVGADVSGADFIECQLDGADFSRAKMHKTTFVTCRGEGVRFCAAELRQGIFVHGSAFPTADFSDADMEKANLRGTSLVGAVLDRANLTDADLSECDATDASFERTVLKGGMMIRTKLVGASLDGANLMDALMSKAQVQAARFIGANLFRADMSRVRGDDATRLTDAEVAHVRFLPKANPDRGGQA